MELGGWGVLIALLSLPGLIAPGLMYGISAALSFRTPERVEPSTRRLRVLRLGSATTLNLGIVFAVIGFWPGGTKAAATAALIAGLTGIAIVIVATIIAAATRSRRRVRESDDDLPPDEPSELAYGMDYLAIGIYLVLGVVFAVILLGVGQREEAPEPDWFAPPVLTPEQQESVDEFSRETNTLHVIDYPVFDAVPADMLALRSPLYEVVDSAAREPRSAWEESETEFADTPELGTRESLVSGALRDADLVLTYSALACPVAGLVVIETESTVTIGTFTKLTAVPTPSPTSTPDPTDPSRPCFGGNYIFADRYPVTLSEPLGDREIIGLDGNPLRSPFRS